MIRTDNKSLCSGCKACSLVCPKNSISFLKDTLGSYYACVDEKTCIDCGACQKVCPIQNINEESFIGLDAFAAYSKDTEQRFRGSSGAMFEAISRWIVNQKGSVFACKFDDNLKLKMIEASTMQDVRKLTKSKYLQSESSYIFPTIKERVKQGKFVLVCSTPCQIAALKKYLGELSNSENLYLLDFFCHGVPPQELFDKCIDYVEQRGGIEIIDYEFRSKKKNGSTPHYYTVKYRKNGHEEKKIDFYLNDPFYLGFQKYITLRDSCYQCPYGRGNHEGDLTIGDFHDIDKYVKGINRFDGVSTVIVNSGKGKLLWDRIKGSMIVHQMDIKKLYSDKQIFSGGTSKPARREEFVGDMGSLPFNKVVNKWFDSKKEWKKAIYYRLPRLIRNQIKTLAKL